MQNSFQGITFSKPLQTFFYKVDARIIIGEFSIYRATEVFCEVSIHEFSFQYFQTIVKRVRTRLSKVKLAEIKDQP